MGSDKTITTLENIGVVLLIIMICQIIGTCRGCVKDSKEAFDNRTIEKGVEDE